MPRENMSQDPNGSYSNISQESMSIQEILEQADIDPYVIDLVQVEVSNLEHQLSVALDKQPGFDDGINEGFELGVGYVNTERIIQQAKAEERARLLKLVNQLQAEIPTVSTNLFHEGTITGQRQALNKVKVKLQQLKEGE